MQQSIFTVKENRQIAKDTWQLRLEGDSSAMTAPGQFAALSIPGAFLRRPFSVTDWAEGGIRLCYQVVGRGTDIMTGLKAGDSIDVLCGLGNGFDTAKAGDRPLLIGGGLGASPMFALCRALCAEGKKPTVLLGFGSAEYAVLIEEFEAMGAKVLVATDDGSMGHRGFVTELMTELDYSFFYTCGPEGMYRAINRVAVSEGEISLEARMGCGFGACMGCSVETKKGMKRVCKDGPVMERSELIW